VNVEHVTNNKNGDDKRPSVRRLIDMDNSIFLRESVMRGHHIFKGIWTPRTEEIVQVRQETLVIEMLWLCSKPMEWWLDMCLALSCWVPLDSKAF